MANVKISDLPVATNISSTDITPFNISSTTSQIAWSIIAAKTGNVVSVKDPSYGAVGDGTTDDAPAIQAAHDALPSTGGVILFPPATGYLFATRLYFSKNVHLIGVSSSSSSADPVSAKLIKKSTLNDTGVLLTGPGTVMENIVVLGQVGNGGDNILVNGNAITLRNVASYKAGQDGIRIGNDAGANSNTCMLDNVTASENVRDGIHVHDSVPDANALLIIRPACLSNGRDGIHFDKCSSNAIIAPLTETNVRDGIRFTGNSTYHSVTGGDPNESNGGKAVYIDTGATGMVIDVPNLPQAQITNLGTKTILRGPQIQTTSWTPTFRGSGTAGTYELALNNSTYYYDGAQVRLTVRVQFAGALTGGGTGDLQITNLPISKRDNTFPVGVVMLDGLTFGAGNLSAVFNTAAPSTTLNIALSTSGAGYSVLAIGAISTNDTFTVSITYDV